MKLLADENLDSAIVEWLRANGHDVVWTAEGSPGATDPEVLAAAASERRIVITNDLDFGQLAIAENLPCCGLVLLRLGAMRRQDAIERFKATWRAAAQAALGSFVVIGERATRVRPLRLPDEPQG